MSNNYLEICKIKEKYCFYNKLQSLYKENFSNFTNLENTHKLLDTINDNEFYKKPVQLFGVNDRNSPFVKLFYKCFDTDYEFLYEYIRFVKENIKPLFKNEKKLLIQKTPNIRFQLPGFSNIGKLNSDPNENIIGLHKDSHFNHPKEEYNIILPITEMYDTNSIYHEEYPNSNKNPSKFKSLTLKKNEFCKIYLNQMLHYNKINKTKITRVSFDFRVIPLSKYKENNLLKSATNNIKFKPGDYYMLI